MILDAITEAKASGCTEEDACEVAGVSSRTVGRWRKTEGHGDQRQGPHKTPPNTLSNAERDRVLEVVNSPEFRDVSPKQIVPRLADRGEYIASESTMYRILREEEQLAHREPTKVREPRPISSHDATGPNQVYSWDITYLPAGVRGSFFFLYFFIDIWSRKIVGWDIYTDQTPELAAALFRRLCQENAVNPKGLVLHSDNGGAMKGATMLKTLQELGVIASFSRPSVSDDNAFSEALFKTVKFRPGYPGQFDNLDAAKAWVDAFVAWYNNEHRHSAIRYVTPAQRHAGEDIAILQRRHEIYQRAQQRHPERWSGPTRNWNPVEAVHLNPRKKAA